MANVRDFTVPRVGKPLQSLTHVGAHHSDQRGVVRAISRCDVALRDLVGQGDTSSTLGLLATDRVDRAVVHHGHQPRAESAA